MCLYEIWKRCYKSIDFNFKFLIDVCNIFCRL